jgi:hypothetical protein
MDEHHVRVAAVTGLVAAEPSHGDHGHPGRQRPAQLGLDLPRRRVQRRVDGGRDHRGQRVGDLGRAEPAEQVGRGDPQQLPAQQGPDRGDGAFRVAVPPDGRIALGLQGHH